MPSPVRISTCVRWRPAPPAARFPRPPGDILAACKLAGFDLLIVETSGIGQGDAAIVPLVDRSLYVMTPEFGAASQLEKIDMLDFADAVAINKFDRKGAEDALRDVRKQVQRNRKAFGQSPDDMPVYGTIAARFNDDGVTALYHGVVGLLREQGLDLSPGRLPPVTNKASSGQTVIVPAARARYLAEIADTVRGYHRHVEEQVRLIRQRQQLRAVQAMLETVGKPVADLQPLLEQVEAQVDPHARKLVDMWPQVRESYLGDEYVVKIRDKEIRTPDPSLAVRHPHSQGGDSAPGGAWRTAALDDAGESARQFPLYRRGVRLQARETRTRPGCSPARATRSAPTAASRSCPSTPRPPGYPPPSIRDAVRLRPGRTAGHLRQGW